MRFFSSASVVRYRIVAVQKRTVNESFRNNDYFATFTFDRTEIEILYGQADIFY